MSLLKDEAWLPAGAQERVLDRLAGLEAVVTREVMERVLQQTGRRDKRRRPLTHAVTLWITMARGLLTDRPIHVNVAGCLLLLATSTRSDSILRWLNWAAVMAISSCGA